MSCRLARTHSTVRPCLKKKQNQPASQPTSNKNLPKKASWISCQTLRENMPAGRQKPWSSFSGEGPGLSCACQATSVKCSVQHSSLGWKTSLLAFQCPQISLCTGDLSYFSFQKHLIGAGSTFPLYPPLPALLFQGFLKRIHSIP